MSRYIREKLKQPNTYALALLVGTLINLYGHFLVPYLRRHPNPIGRFVTELREYPGTVMLSILLAYCFPLLVGLYSSVATRFATRRYEYRALFPDSKPDPVFRADHEGNLVDMGSTTERFFAELGIRRAQDFLGEAFWSQLVSGQGELLESSTIRSPATNGWYVVSSAPGPAGTLHVYAAPCPARSTRRGDEPDEASSMQQPPSPTTTGAEAALAGKQQRGRTAAGRAPVRADARLRTPAQAREHEREGALTWGPPGDRAISPSAVAAPRRA